MRLLFISILFLSFFKGITQININIITKDFDSNETLKFVDVDVSNTYNKLFSLKTDYNGLLIIDSLKKHDTITLFFYKKKEYCDCKTYKMSIVLYTDSIKVNDTLVAKIKGIGHDCVNSRYFSYYHPFSIDCYSDPSENSKEEDYQYQNQCFCFQNEKNAYLLNLFTFLKCYNNLKIELVASCSDKEYTEYGNQINVKRIDKIKKIFIEQGISVQRIKSTLLGNGQHYSDKNDIKKQPLFAKKLKLEAKNTYVIIKVLYN